MKPVDRSTRRTACAIGFFLIFSLLSAILILLSCSLRSRSNRMFTLTEEELRTLKLTYYSDYFSFIGRDDQGMVAFALDNNRGQDKDSWQAEHFVVLHDEKTGWQPAKGSGPYENSSGQLERIPDSPFFTFEGTVSSGLIIRTPRTRFPFGLADTSLYSRKEGPGGIPPRVSRSNAPMAGKIAQWPGDSRVPLCAGL